MGLDNISVEDEMFLFLTNVAVQYEFAIYKLNFPMPGVRLAYLLHRFAQRFFPQHCLVTLDISDKTLDQAVQFLTRNGVTVEPITHSTVES